MEIPDIDSIKLFFTSVILAIKNHTIWSIIGTAIIKELNTIITGAVALIAARWAYKAATRDTRYRQYLDMKRVLAYTQSMLFVVENLKKTIEEMRKQFSALKRNLKKEQKSNLQENLVEDCPITLPKEINSNDWENHALLEERETELIVTLSTEIIKYNEDIPAPSDQLKHINKFYNDTQELEGLLKKSFDEKKKS